MKNFKDELCSWLVLVVILGTLIFGAFYLKMWQCDEMFPNANILACIIWK